MVSRIIILSAAVFLIAQAFSIDPFKIDKVPPMNFIVHTFKEVLVKIFLSDGRDSRKLTTRLTHPTQRKQDAMLFGGTTQCSSCNTFLFMFIVQFNSIQCVLHHIINILD